MAQQFDLDPRINWTADDRFEIEDVEFVVDTTAGPRRPSERGSFTIVKNKPFLDFYSEHVLGGTHRDVFELGIFQGGSTALFDLLLKPDNFVALDNRREPLDPLDHYIESHGRDKQVEIAYGANQADRGLLAEICDRRFPAGIDLVCDDASHHYDLTKASFEVLFPRLRPGGLYVIEDWAWAHTAGGQSEDHYLYDRPALTNLIFELVMLLGSPPNWIAEISMTPFAALIRRGKAPVSDKVLDIDGTYCIRNREFVAI